MATNQMQSSVQNANLPFLLNSGKQALYKFGATLLTDGSRTVVLRECTVMAKVAATGKWVPWTNAAATDGTAIPAGILYPAPGGIAAADLAAGDVANVSILVADALIDGT